MADNSTNPVDVLAQDIRTIDGDHSLGAGELAQKLSDLGYVKIGGGVVTAFRSEGSMNDGGAKLQEADGELREGQLEIPDADGNIFVHVTGSWPFRVKLSDNDATFIKNASKAPTAQVDPHPPLRSYQDGEHVEVVKDGDWLKGFIQDRDKVSGYLHVHTRRGPVTIASRTSIKRLTS